MKKQVVVVAFVAVAVLAAVGLYMVSSSDRTAPDKEQPSSSSSAADTSQQTLIAYTDSGFSPKTLTVKVGSTITVRNDSSRKLQFSSDVHPTHTDNPELNADVIDPGETTTVTITNAGTWGIHDHLNASRTATIIAEE